MNHTRIEWVKNPDGTQGYTWNPITGCLNGCSYCYARKLANTRLKERYLKQSMYFPDRTYTEQAYTDPFYPRFWPERLSIPDSRLPTMRNWSAIAWAAIANSKRRGIFVCDMSDLFGIGIPEEWTERVLVEIKRHENDRFYLLTKQPQNLIKFSPFPDNCWVGVTATTDAQLSSAILYLHNIKAKVKYISFEPLLEQMKDLSFTLKYSHIADWVIIGGQSGKEKFYPPEDWIQEIESACNKVRIPVFEKDNLRKVWYNYPRQEMPMEGDYANSRRTQKG